MSSLFRTLLSLAINNIQVYTFVSTAHAISITSFTMDASRIGRLPAELRNRIYGYAPVHDEPLDFVLACGQRDGQILNILSACWVCLVV